MKHLKQYENTNNFKKYNIFWYWKIGFQLRISEFIELNTNDLYKNLINNENSVIDVTMLYKYDSNGLKKLEIPDNTSLFVNNNTKYPLVYESDNIDDCIKNISYIFDTYKYNI